MESTLDRHRPFRDDEEREHYYEVLLREFRREAIRIAAPAAEMLAPDDAFELLARHHGVPSPILDWTSSPYIASFFAFEGADASGDSVAIWVLDRGRVDLGSRGVSAIDDPGLLRFNRRALQQNGLFTRVRTVRRPVEELLAEALTKVVLPASMRPVAMADLDAMVINATTLFADLDGAARTARYRAST